MEKLSTGAIRHESRRLIRELGFLNTEFTAAGVTHQQCHTILEVGNYGQLSSMDLANYLNLDKSTISRVVQQLEDLKLIQMKPSENDRRKKLIGLTEKGQKKYLEINRRADEIVTDATRTLTEAETSKVIEGMRVYAAALKKGRIQREYTISRMAKTENKAVRDLIHTVMPEFGCEGPGFALNDPEVRDMYATYNLPRSVYLVLKKGDKVVGGGGIAPLTGGSRDTCELRKMYFLPEARGTGMGKVLLEQCLREAKKFKFKKCYLETARFMSQAQRLYDRLGFEPLEHPLGNTGHHACDRWYLKEL